MMYDLTNMSKELGENKDIVSIEDRTNAYMNRAFVTFKNGHTLSIIIGTYSYGGDEGLFEIMPSDTSIIDDNDVLGYLTADDIRDYIKVMAALPSIILALEVQK